MKPILFFIILILLLLIYCSYINTSSPKYIDTFNESQKYVTNPKPVMWVYWELRNGNISPPDYIQLCLEIIHKNGSKYFDVVMLNEKNIFDYIPDLRKDINDLPIALKTDYIRIKLLYMYGGLWIDADTILMNNLKDIAGKINSGVDFIGFGCTGAVCKDQEGFTRPSNGVIGSIKHGRLVERCLKELDNKLNDYYNTPIDKRKDFNYFDLGKTIIWNQYDKLIKEDPSYKSYHVPSYADGTRDVDGRWIAKNIIFKKNFKYSRLDELLVVMLVNSSYCGDDSDYNWFCKLSREDILNGDYFITSLFKKALAYDPYND